MHIFSCYAPSWVTARSVKDEFYTDLDAALSGVHMCGLKGSGR